jgi:hypothetical protein
MTKHPRHYYYYYYYYHLHLLSLVPGVDELFE